MDFVFKLTVSIAVIICATQVGRRLPNLAGLIATMPLTSLIVMVWLYSDNPGNRMLMIDYTKGVLWGILPTIAFFAVAFVCFGKQLPFAASITAASAAWLFGAVVHQLLLR